MDRFEEHFNLKVLKNTKENLMWCKMVADRSPATEYHLIINDKKVAFITHPIWEECKYCNSNQDENGIIQIGKS